ncbi:MAG: hypothetical protein Q4F74_06310 [Synergistaceae bacterium]|nr:hypothetical protein [Synergistaceae bacterium]
MQNGYVLFSPIGSTDPISNYRDGAMLHIARKYHPHHVYLYLSSEMCTLHKSDDRYTESLRLLGEKCGHDFEVSPIERADLSEVYLFDRFYDEFERQLKEIAKRHPDDTILLNVSSGTPAMKSALQTIAALSENSALLPVQVTTPAKHSNPPRDEPQELALLWETDEDNDDVLYEDRTSVSTHLHLAARIKLNSVIKHVEAYDYHAALSVARDISADLPPDALRLLEAANARIRLDMTGVKKTLGETTYRFLPIEDGSLVYMSEYLLWLEVKLLRLEYTDFIRGITPIIADLFELFIQKKLKIEIRRYCTIDKDSKVATLRGNKMSDPVGVRMLAALNMHYKYGYADGPLSSDNMLVVIKAFCSDQRAVELSERIRDEVEAKCRNMAAHEIVSVTPEWVKSKCGYSPSDILDMIFSMADMSGIPRARMKNSYNDMNGTIKGLLRLVPERAVKRG